ncbi:MAG: 30S ribosomal protein S5 [Planctomycetota bacterium]|nr:MAG: 30S ribosomal protein S5 [Planctomycetota bacterium]
MARFHKQREEQEREFLEITVKISRVATVVKGGRRFSFNALVVVGDEKGRVGYGFGKAKEVPMAIQKASKEAKRNLIKVPLVEENTVPHTFIGKYCSSKVILIPAHPGTGIVAGPAVRAVMSACGITNILTKSFGSNNPINLVKATFNALENMRSKEEVEKLRGVAIDADTYGIPSQKEEEKVETK